MPLSHARMYFMITKHLAEEVVCYPSMFRRESFSFSLVDFRRSFQMISQYTQTPSSTSPFIAWILRRNPVPRSGFVPLTFIIELSNASVFTVGSQAYFSFPSKTTASGVGVSCIYYRTAVFEPTNHISGQVAY